MAKVQTGAKQPLSQTRQQAQEQQAMRQTQQEAAQMSPQEKQQLNQAAEKEQLREEVANNGKFVAKGDVNVGEKLPLIFGCKRIGRWGMVEGGDTKFCHSETHPHTNSKQRSSRFSRKRQCFAGWSSGGYDFKTVE